MVEDNDEFLQSLSMILSTNLEEWFLNPEFGFDRFVVLGQKEDRERTIESIYAALLQHNEVDSVEDVEMELDRTKRELKIFFNVTKTDGQAISGEVTA